MKFLIPSEIIVRAEIRKNAAQKNETRSSLNFDQCNLRIFLHVAMFFFAIMNPVHAMPSSTLGLSSRILTQKTNTVSQHRVHVTSDNSNKYEGGNSGVESTVEENPTTLKTTSVSIFRTF